MAKQRPGTKNSQQAGKDRQKIADANYDDIAAAPADLKSLIAGVKQAQSKLTNQQQRLSKKQIAQQKKTLDDEYKIAKMKEDLVDQTAKVDAEIAAEEKALVEEQKKELVTKVKEKKKKKKKQKSISDFNTLIKNLEDSIDRHMSNLVGVSTPDVNKLKNTFADVYRAWQKAKSKTTDPDHDKLVQAEKQGTIDELMVGFKKSIDFLAKVGAQNNDKIKKRKELEKGQKTALVPYGQLYRSKLERFVDMGRDKEGKASISRSLALAASMVGRDLKNQIAKAGPSSLLTQGTSWALSKAGNNRGAVSAILKVDKSLRYVGTAVKDAGASTVEWFQKSMGSMLGYLKRKWAQLASGSSAGGIGKLIGYAALFSALIKPMLEGINKELEARFGPHYVKDFLAATWATAKEWMISGLRRFIFGDPTADEKPAQAGSDLAVQQGLRNGLHPTIGTNADMFAKDWGAKKTPEQTENLLRSTLRSYQAHTGDEKEVQRKYLQFYLNGGNGIRYTQLSKPLYDDLKTAGFDVKRFSPSVDKRSTNFGAAPAPGSSVGKPGSVTAPTAAGGAYGSVPQKVVATPPSSQGTDSGTSTGGKAANPKGVALGNSSFPSNGVSDALNALGSGLLVNP